MSDSSSDWSSSQLRTLWSNALFFNVCPNENQHWRNVFSVNKRLLQKYWSAEIQRTFRYEQNNYFTKVQGQEKISCELLNGFVSLWQTPLVCRQRKCCETEGFERHRQSSTEKTVITPPILSLHTHPHTHKRLLALTRAHTWAPAWGPPMAAETLSLFPHMLPHDLRLCEFLMEGLFLSTMCEVKGFKLATDRYVLQTSGTDILRHCLASAKRNKLLDCRLFIEHWIVAIIIIIQTWALSLNKASV